VLKSEFYYRAPGSDKYPDDIIYIMRNTSAGRFFQEDYLHEISRFTDSTNQDTLKAFTKRDDLF
jgi:hypothetical protein